MKKITPYQRNKMKNILATSSKEVVDQLTKADPKDIEEAVKRTHDKCIYCGFPVDEGEETCEECEKKHEDRIIDGQIEQDLLEERRDLSPKEDEELKIKQ